MNRNHFFSIAFLISHSLCAQIELTGGKSDSVALQLVNYVVNNLQEKAYVVTDQPYYALGDTIWFQTYLVNAIAHEPVTLSNTLYVDLINPEGEVLKSLILLSDKGLAPGEFALDEDWPPGKYMIQAYTRWMLNFSEEFLFRKSFDVFNIWPQDYAKEDVSVLDVASIPSKVVSENQEMMVRLFPEGGNLVPGFPAMIGVKATYKGQDKGLPVSGSVINGATGDTVTHFACNAYGVGGFYLADPVGAYHLQIDSPAFAVTYEFPKPRRASFGLKVINRYQAKTIHIMLETDIPSGLEGGFLIGHTRGQTFAVLSMNGVGALPRKILSIDAKVIPTGIAHFTFFDAKGVPRAERLTFVNHEDKMVNAKVDVNLPVLKKRQKVDCIISIPDTLVGNVSIAVTNASVIQRNSNHENIGSYFLLGSDLSGNVEDPGHYLTGLNKEKHQELDYLMLTHGWRRFVWEDVLLVDTLQKPFVPEAGITLSGQLKNFTFRNKTEAGTVQLISMIRKGSSVENGFSFDMMETDTNGRFLFNNLHYWDSVKFILQAKKTSESLNYRYYIQLDTTISPTVPIFDQASHLDKPIEEAFITKSNRAFIIDKSYDQEVIVLDEIAIEASVQNPFDEAIEGRYGSPDYRLIADSLFRQPAFLVDVLRQIPFIQFSQEGALRIRGKFPTVFLDGFELDATVVTDIIQSTPGHDVYFVDTDRSGFSNSRGNPVIYVYTKSGNGVVTSQKGKQTPGVLQVFHSGYYRAREFYAPNYAGGTPKEVKPDYRLMLFWKPQLAISEGQAQASFYVGDDAEVFDVVVEGMTNDGAFIAVRTQITVE